MSLIVEDGTGKADAESYASVADADTYHSKRANAAWASLTTEVKEANLRKATDYMVQAYRLAWDGNRATADQALDWPRAWVRRSDYLYSTLNGYTVIGGDYYYPSNIVPVEVVQACCSLALTASTEDLAPPIDRMTTREKVGPIEIEYAEYGVQYKRFRSIDNILAPFLRSVGASKMLVRV